MLQIFVSYDREASKLLTENYYYCKFFSKTEKEEDIFLYSKRN
jgi:hypothetical protein